MSLSNVIILAIVSLDYPNTGSFSTILDMAGVKRAVVVHYQIRNVANKNNELGKQIWNISKINNEKIFNDLIKNIPKGDFKMFSYLSNMREIVKKEFDDME